MTLILVKVFLASMRGCVKMEPATVRRVKREVIVEESHGGSLWRFIL